MLKKTICDSLHWEMESICCMFLEIYKKKQFCETSFIRKDDQLKRPGRNKNTTDIYRLRYKWNSKR